MEHEVFVPFSADTVRRAVADPTRVARCVPGFQPDTDAAPEAPDALVGRLRLRVGNSTITYRGTLRITPQDGGDLAVEADGAESRGSGSVKLALTVRLSAGDGGSVLTCGGTVRSEGRLAEVDDAAAAAAGRRLLDRFASELTASLESAPLGSDEDDDNQRAIPGIPSPDNGAHARSTEAAESAERAARAEGDESEAAAASLFETEVPPPSLDPLADADADDDTDDDAGAEGESESGDDVEPELDDDLEPGPPAEAAHARRTMIGRSAEEVDHAPPRGRYAPVPAPQPASTTVTLRWAAPAAAVVVASAVVVGRILRRRR
ncbi:SRPBCC domain-containing protein [Streptomyces sp. 8N706]|uniref:SRPBCC domain-containing protein n=1 Tax=Streptomyces sp. 8N706 TaxID=3457416 RepID=UPI003FD1892D